MDNPDLKKKKYRLVENLTSGTDRGCRKGAGEIVLILS